MSTPVFLRRGQPVTRFLTAATLLVALLCALVAPAVAADSTGTDQVKVSLERYEKLMAAARAQAVGTAAWTRGEVNVTLPDAGGRFATVDVTATVKTSGDKNVRVLLLPGDQVITSATIGGDKAKIVQRNGAQFAIVPSGGEYKVSLSYVTAVTANASAKGTIVALPPLPGAALEVDGPGAGSAQIVPAAETSTSGDNLTASLPATQAFAIAWGGTLAASSVKRVDYEIAQDKSGNGADVTARFEVVVGLGGHELQVAPADAALMEVRDGKANIAAHVDEDWHVVKLRGRGEHIVVARFRLTVDRSSGQPQIEMPLTKVPITRVSATMSGKGGIEFDPEVPITTNVRGAGKAAVTVATAFLPPSEKLTLSWTETRAAPEARVSYNTVTSQLIKLDEGVLTSRITLSYELIKGKLSSLLIAIPEDVVVFKVTGPVQDWRTFAKSEERPRHVRVSLSDSESNGAVELRLQRTVKAGPGAEVTIPVVRPLNAFRETGVVALLAGDKVSFGAAKASEAFIKAGQDALPVAVRKKLEDKVSQAYRHVGAPGTLSAKVVAARKEAVRFDARVTGLYTVEERTIAGAASIVVEIKSGRLEHVVLSLPANVAEPRITAPSLNKFEPDRKTPVGKDRKAYDVRFTQGLEGAVTIQVEFEMLQPKNLGKVRLPEVRIHGAEVEEGTLGIGAESSIEVRAEAGKELRRMEVEELPPALRRQSERKLLFGFSYAQVPWTLGLDVKRHKTVQTLRAVVIGAWLETNVLSNGHVVSRARYLVDNADRQFLRVGLTEAAKVLSVAADGREVKARRDEKGAIAIPLPPNRKIVVELRYETVLDKPGLVEHVELAAPAIDMRENAVAWVVRLPDERRALRMEGELTKAGPHRWRPPSGQKARGLQVPMSRPEGAHERYFIHPVHDPKDEALTLTITHMASESDGVAWLLLILGVLGIGLYIFRRIAGRRGKLDLVFFLVGAALIGLKMAIWQVDDVQLIGIGAVLVAAAVWAGVLRLKAKMESSS